MKSIEITNRELSVTGCATVEEALNVVVEYVRTLRLEGGWTITSQTVGDETPDARGSTFYGYLTARKISAG